MEPTAGTVPSSGEPDDKFVSLQPGRRETAASSMVKAIKGDFLNGKPFLLAENIMVRTFLQQYG
ncbi:hypothetical protein [Paenibacillus sp. DMB5]|uniref:hypothetical protein n=1 Tax=Paenibacillus sp. DMB5 TaxID=1780103 RepID=UPI0018E3014A|nr:hypothetical protein [Paenibacillus sp. DMB5]